MDYSQNSDLSLGTDQESTNSKFEPGEFEVRELSKKVQEQIDQNIEKQNAFKIERERKLPRRRLTPTDIKKFVDNLENPKCPDLDSTPLFETERKSYKYYKKLLELDKRFQDYLDFDEPFGLETSTQCLAKEEIRGSSTLLQILAIPRRLIRNRIKLRKKNRDLVFSIVICFVICFCVYKIMIIVSTIVTPLLKSAFLALKDKLSRQTSKSKKESQSEESKVFWDNHLDYLSEVIKISRGGSLIPIREANIYDFSELDEQQALLFVSPIPSYIKLERSKLELEKLIIESQRTGMSRERLRMKLKKFFSNFKELISLPDRYDISKSILIVIGSIIFLMGANRGTMILDRTPKLYNNEILVPTQPSVPSILPKVEPSIKEESRNIKSIMIESKDSLKEALTTPSRLKSGDRVRKKAKLVRLSDLPPLPNQASDSEMDSPLMARPTSIKIPIQ
uniref:Uncharacterized protein n=1 Tax=Nitzschia palea TaxID=303400 RepID=A0A2Z5ZBP2_9STRA|nr:hypothetical protein [Nitzschia palea]